MVCVANDWGNQCDVVMRTVPDGANSRIICVLLTGQKICGSFLGGAMTG